MPVPLPTATTRWRCTLCGNLTRFDVTRSSRVVEYVHLDLAGEPAVEETEVLAEKVAERAGRSATTLVSSCVCPHLFQNRKDGPIKKLSRLHSKGNSPTFPRPPEEPLGLPAAFATGEPGVARTTTKPHQRSALDADA
jgi:hypothetical protein